MNQNRTSNALIIGASQGIGLGFVKKLLNQRENKLIYATYRRREAAAELMELASAYPDRLNCLAMDITDEGQIEAGIAEIQGQTNKLHYVVNCVGILHEGTLKPEKSLRQINAEQLTRYFQVNSIGSVLLAKYLLPLFRHSDRSIFASISAKIGSIGDNRLGGWYGYRASKAALNMLMRTVSIEYSRKSPRTIVVTLHPGTTDTRLSQPFQKNVPTDKLFSVERTVNQLFAVVEKLEEKDSGQFFSWDGNPLPW
ncbi:MAG: SDR family NAD(P)-dependent oxidoreductase [Symploca sp. SIO1B1]|nr:SDR family NAD(P)-dependent oxidoreductase [Symploca sp. SIO1C2]NER95433.1 SDR family NAD(P)-dependent oxidoreductase [Symploca sp. SIO1B1]